jgi:hypothetical protein
MNHLRGAMAGAVVLNVPSIVVVPQLAVVEALVLTVATACAGAGLGGLTAWSFSKHPEPASEAPGQALEREAA